MSLNTTLKTISNPVSRQILELLKDGKKTAGNIAKEFDLSNATISYHLSNLKKADLIHEEKQKNFIYYELNVSLFEDILLWITTFQQGEKS